MSVTHTYRLAVAQGSATLSGAPTEVGGTEVLIDQDIAASQTNLAAAVAFAYATLRSIYLLSSKNLTVKVNGTDAVQTFTSSGTVSSGTWTATFGGQTATAIAYNSSAAALQTKLVALSSIGAGGVVCTGGPLPTAIVCTFAGALGLAAQSTITTNSGGIVGGGSIGCASTTTGVAADKTIALVAGDPFIWRASPGYFANPFAADVTKLSYTSSTATTKLQGRILNP